MRQYPFYGWYIAPYRVGRLSASRVCIGIDQIALLLQSLGMIPFPHVALLITAARYGFPSGNDASPSSPNSSHAVAPSAAPCVCDGGCVTAHSIHSDLLDRSQTSSPSSPRRSVVEPTAGVIVCDIATPSTLSEMHQSLAHLGDVKVCVTAHSDHSGLLSRSQTSSPSLPGCSVVEPTSGIICGTIAMHSSPAAPTYAAARTQMPLVVVTSRSPSTTTGTPTSRS